jgi:hypothetical protein
VKLGTLKSNPSRILASLTITAAKHHPKSFLGAAIVPNFCQRSFRTLSITLLLHHVTHNTPSLAGFLSELSLKIIKESIPPELLSEFIRFAFFSNSALRAFFANVFVQSSPYRDLMSHPTMEFPWTETQVQCLQRLSDVKFPFHEDAASALAAAIAHHTETAPDNKTLAVKLSSTILNLVTKHGAAMQQVAGTLKTAALRCPTSLTTRIVDAVNKLCLT